MKKKTIKKKRFQFDFRLARIVFKTSLQAALSRQKKKEKNKQTYGLSIDNII